MFYSLFTLIKNFRPLFINHYTPSRPSFISSPLHTEKYFFFHLKIREGGKNINKMEIKYFYFHSDFWKNMVGSPENQKIEQKILD